MFLLCNKRQESNHYIEAGSGRMIRSILITIFLVLTLPSIGQVSTFSKFFGVDSFYSTNYTVLADGDSVVLLGDYLDGISRQGPLFIKTDIDGHEAYRTQWIKPDTIFGGHFALCGNVTSSHYFIVGAQMFRSGAINAYDVLCKLKSNLDTEYIKVLNYSPGCSYLPFATELSDKNYLMAGYKRDCNSTKLSALLIKTDTLGNIIWTLEESHPNNSFFTCTSPFIGGFYVIGQIETDNNAGDSLLQIHKYDNDGNLIWKKDFGRPGFNNVTGPMIPTRDGGLLYILNRLDTNAVLGAPTYTMPSVIYRLDRGGNLIWQKWLTYGNVVSIHETKSGSIVFCENLLALPFSGPLLNNAFSGALFKLGADGHAIWQQYFTEGVDTNYDNYFFDVTEGADGGIFATGQAVPLHGQHNQIWLVKVDSNGCLNGNCPQLYTGIKEENESVGVLVYPNPARSQFTVAFSETSDFRRYREPVFELTDVTGRTVLQSTLAEQSMTFSCDGLAQGVYLYAIRSESRFVVSGKVVIR